MTRACGTVEGVHYCHITTLRLWIQVKLPINKKEKRGKEESHVNQYLNENFVFIGWVIQLPFQQAQVCFLVLYCASCEMFSGMVCGSDEFWGVYLVF